MKKLSLVVVFVLMIGALLLSACGAAPTATAAAPTATVAATTAPTPVATVPAGSLVQNDHLLMCSDVPYPPQEFFDENGNPQGLDVEIGQEIAKRLGLQFQVVNSVFDSIIAAVTSGKCDIIISAMNITADRNKQVSMIPYFQAGQSIVVVKGNPENINSPMDLCGKTAAAESGTTEAAYLQGTDDYLDKGLIQQCTAAGKDPVTVVITQKDTDALQQLQSNKVAAYFTDSPVAGYYVSQHADQFQVAGQIIEPIVQGIAFPCAEKDCTNAPFTPVGQAIQTAFNSMVADGTYLKILTEYNLQSSAVSK
jgi:polar amino acid transport system substrate-binding protein